MSASLPLITYSVVGTCASLSALTVFVASSIYDVRMIKYFRPLKRQPGANRFRRRPLVSIIMVATSGDAARIAASLESIDQKDYRKLEVIIIDNGAHVVAQSKKNLRVIKKRTAVSEKVALTTANQAANGEVTVVLQPGYTLMPDTLKNTVNYFLLDETLGGIVALAQRDSKKYSVTSQILQLGYVVRRRAVKAYSLRRTPKQAPFSASRHTRLSKGELSSVLYAADVHVAMAERQKHRGFSLRGLAIWLLCASSVAAQVYLGYLALVLHVGQPLMITVSSLILFSLLALLSDDQVSLRQKLRTLLLAPFWYTAGFLYMVGRVLKPSLIISRIRIRFSLAP